jgi:hypothetical protein
VDEGLKKSVEGAIFDSDADQKTIVIIDNIQMIYPELEESYSRDRMEEKGIAIE